MIDSGPEAGDGGLELVFAGKPYDLKIKPAGRNVLLINRGAVEKQPDLQNSKKKL